MTKGTRAPAITLHGPTGLVAAVPALLGFHPQESLVLLCLRRPGLLGPIARVDLTGGDRPPPAAMAAQLTSYAVRYAESAAVICYTDSQGRPALLDATIEALERAEVPLLEVLCVRHGVIRSARTAAVEAKDHGLPEPPEDDPQVEGLAALNAAHGRGVLADRGALTESIAPPIGPALDEARAAIVATCADLAAVPDAGRDRIEAAMVARATRALARARRQLREAGRVASGTAAELIVLVNSVAARDSVIARAVAEYDSDWVATLISVVSRCPPEEAAEICSVLAVVAYRYGDGALSQVAIDRCLAAEPRHRLAHLMLSATATGIPPEELAELATAGAVRAPRRTGMDGPRRTRSGGRRGTGS